MAEAEQVCSSIITNESLVDHHNEWQTLIENDDRLCRKRLNNEGDPKKMEKAKIEEEQHLYELIGYHAKGKRLESVTYRQQGQAQRNLSHKLEKYKDENSIFNPCHHGRVSPSCVALLICALIVFLFFKSGILLDYGGSDIPYDHMTVGKSNKNDSVNIVHRYDLMNNTENTENMNHHINNSTTKKASVVGIMSNITRQSFNTTEPDKLGKPRKLLQPLTLT